MASLNINTENKKGKPKKQNLRVDFTPMVDMNMLLITFFMFCTTLSKPQVMDIAMPTNDIVQCPPKVKLSKTITLLLGADNKVFYYTDMLDEVAYNNYLTLKETDFSVEGLRSILLQRNQETISKIVELKRYRQNSKEMTDDEFFERVKEIKNNPDKQVVIIKPTQDSSYGNLVDALDEMAICSIGTYSVEDITEGDNFLIKNYQTKGEYGKEVQLIN